MLKPKNPVMDGLRQLMYTNICVLKKYAVDKLVENWPDDSINSTSSIYKWMEGERDIPFHQLINFVIASKDSVYLEYLANQCGYSIIPQIKDKTTLKVFAHLFKIMESTINGKNNE